MSTTLNLRELQAPIKAAYQTQPDKARITLRMVAAAMGIEIQALEVEAIGDLDLRGTLGMGREVPVGFSGIRCETRVTVKDDGRPERAKRLLENAERYCVVLNTLRQGVPVESAFQLTSA